MSGHNGTLHSYPCSEALLLPLINESDWSREARAFLYLLGLLYLFLGVAIIAEIFMTGIERITSATRKVYRSRGEHLEPELVEERIWNGTVANLTLMALGSSAPEILLSIIEIIGNRFESGSLGPGVIVGAAAFNLMCVTAVCLTAIPGTDSRKIKGLPVFTINTVTSILAYIWLIVILLGISKDVVEIWEAVVTFLLFPVMVYAAYLADTGLPSWLRWKKRIGDTASKAPNVTANLGDKQNQQKMELSSIKSMEVMSDSINVTNNNLQPDTNELAKWIRQATNMGLTGEDAAKLAAYKFVASVERSKAWYRMGVTRAISGRRRIKPPSDIKEASTVKPPTEVAPRPLSKTVVEFYALSCAVPERVGKFPVTVLRRGRSNNTVAVRVHTIDGNAVAGKDYVPIDQMLVFEPNEIEKQIMMEIIDDDIVEPDEQFYLQLSQISSTNNNSTSTSNFEFGRICLMEISILNDEDPGTLTFEETSVAFKESVGVAKLTVARRNGAGGDVSVSWRTIDKTATTGLSYAGGQGTLFFKNAELAKVIEIPLFNKWSSNRDERFEVQLFKPTGGSTLGPISTMAVAITSDEEFNATLHRVTELTNQAAVEMHHDHVDVPWIDQIKNAMSVNGGDIENATTMDFVLHFFTFGWKMLFSLVPPASIWGGWLTFVVSLGVIGILTALIGDMASIFGCLVGLDDTVTAISFVALGSALPDLFASRAAAKHERYADNAIGNITGSNSVNVFLGLGLPWMLASIYHAVRGEPFVVKAGSLGFTITVYTVAAALAVGLLVLRRNFGAFGNGELGGPLCTRYASAAFLFVLWLSYVLLSSLETYGHIHGY